MNKLFNEEFCHEDGMVKTYGCLMGRRRLQDSIDRFPRAGPHLFMPQRGVGIGVRDGCSDLALFLNSECGGSPREAAEQPGLCR